MDIIEYKKNYLTSQPSHQFVWLDNNLNIVNSCDTIFTISDKAGKSFVEIFSFLENIQNDILSDEPFLLPKVILPGQEDTEKAYDFLFFTDKQLSENLLVCIIRDIMYCEKSIWATRQASRLAMLENDYLFLQNKSIQLENTLLQMRNQELERSKELKNLFFHKISHELRSPVNGIIGLSEILMEDAGSTTSLKRYIEGICTASKHLRAILDDLLDIGKLETGKVTFQHDPFRLNAIFQQLLLNFLHAIKQKKLSLNFQISPDVPEVLVGDETRLTQIFYNLVSNAIKFTHEGEVRVEANMIEKHTTNCKLLFRVIDTGIGMDEKELAQVFEPYQQFGPFSYHELGSTGLGLSVVKQLVELQQGSIKVSSRKNQGTTFELILPFELEEKGAKQEEGYSYFEGLSALVVDDSEVNLLYIQRTLEDFGFSVQTCQTAGQALSELQKSYYDLLISDVSIPEMSGKLLVDTFEKRNSHKEKTAVIFATGSVENLSSGYPILLKPYNKTQLYNLLKEVIPAEKLSLYGTKYLYTITEGKQDFIKDMMNSFLCASTESMQKMKAILAQKDPSELQKIIHKIKPTAALMGSSVLVRILQILEGLSCSFPPEWEKIEKYMQKALIVMEQACLFFEKQKDEFE